MATATGVCCCLTDSWLVGAMLTIILEMLLVFGIIPMMAIVAIFEIAAHRALRPRH
jgi:hypothetical protein